MSAEGDQKVLEYACPVWENAKGIKDAIGMWDGIAQHAPEINKTKHDNFFGIVQQFSLDAAVLRVSKIYDTTSTRNKKHTAYDLIQYLENNIKKADYWGHMEETINGLAISEDLLLRTSSRKFAIEERLKTLSEIIDHLKNTMPTRENDKALERVVAFRDKRTAHQERLSKTKREWLSTLPPTEDFIRLAVWAEHLSALVAAFFCNTSLLPHSTPCARMSALNILAKALNKGFDNVESAEKWEEYREFYGLRE